MNDKTRVGTIKEIDSNWRSGLATIVFDDGSAVFIESGFGLRQLNSCFDGDFKGQTIEYTADEFGCMEGFDPL